MAKIFKVIHSKLTFLALSFEAMLVELVKDPLHMLLVLCGVFGKHENVIQIHGNMFIKAGTQNLMH